MKSQLPRYCIVAFCITLFSCKSSDNKTVHEIAKNPKHWIEILDPEGSSLIDSIASIDVIADSLNWSEGPLYVAKGDYLLFSDIPANKIYKWKEGQGLTTYLTPSGLTGPDHGSKEPGSNGLLLDADGNLILCQHGDRRIAKMMAPIDQPKPSFVSLADKYNGKRLNSPNDAVFHPNGDLYFTDPPYGLGKGMEDTLKQLDFQGVFRLKPNGQVDVFTREIKYPNGIAFTPDHQALLVSSSDGDNYIWMKYDLDSNGLAKNSKQFAEAHDYQGKEFGGPDGMKVNKTGYLFASGPDGIWIFNPGGKVIAKIHTGEHTSNCAFSTDEHILFMTCDDFVMKVNLR